MCKTDNSTHQTIMYFRLLCSKRRIQFPPISPSVITMSKSERFENMQGRILPNFDESTSRILVDDELIAAFLYINSYGSMHERFPFEVTPAAAIKHLVYLCGNFPNGGTAVAEADDLTDPDHMISSVEKLISAGCNMITICPCNDTMLIKVAKLCEENKVYWAVAWRDILDPEVRDVVYASPYFCGTAVQSDLNAGYAAVKAMGEAGMKKIGLISLDKSSSCAALREKGMQKALDEYGMQVVAEARDLQQAADAAQAVESFIVANPDLDGVYIACSMGMNILDGTLSALEQYDPDNHIKISVIDFLTGLDTCFEKDRIICAQGGIYIPVQIACGMLEMNAILNGGRLGGQAWDVPISFGAVGSAEEFKDYSKFCEGALPTYTFEELQNLFITYNPDVTGEDIIAWGNAFNLADIYAAHADLAAPVKGPNGVEYVPFAK